jgi:hypothetical protein
MARSRGMLDEMFLYIKYGSRETLLVSYLHSFARQTQFKYFRTHVDMDICPCFGV